MCFFNKPWLSVGSGRTHLVIQIGLVRKRTTLFDPSLKYFPTIATFWLVHFIALSTFLSEPTGLILSSTILYQFGLALPNINKIKNENNKSRGEKRPERVKP